MRAQLAVVGVALTAALSGCTALTGGAPINASPTTAAPSASLSPSPMRVVAIATPKPRTAAPGLATTGNSWLPIVKSLSAYGQWLLGNPDPALVGNVATPGCGMANLLTQQITGLLNSKAYVQTSPATISQVVGPSPATTSTVVLTVVAGRAAEPVVSRTGGKTITSFAAYPPGILHVTLDKGADKRWRFCDVQPVGDASSPDDPSVPLV